MCVHFRADRLTHTLRDHERGFRLDASGFTLDSGEVVALSGASGCGKTLLLELLCLIRPPDPGSTFTLTLDETVIDLASAWDRRGASDDIPALRARIFGFVPQSGGLLPFLNVRDNITLSRRIAGVGPDGRTDWLIETLGIGAVAGLYPDQLSIGQRQRVAIARALAHDPPTIIADEPTAALDPAAARTVLGLLLDAACEAGAAVVLSCHDDALLREAGVTRVGFAISEPDAANCVISRLRPHRTAT